MGVHLVNGVVARIVETQHDVALDAIGVVDEEVRDGGAVGNELCANSLGGDLVLAVGALCAHAGKQQRCRGGDQSAGGDHVVGEVAPMARATKVCG